MSLSCHIDTTLNIPIYQQLVDEIRNSIRSGQLAFGEKLPTVQDFSARLGIARGTIKRAYDELEKEQLIEMVQGRGTFVCYRPLDKASRKKQAMAAIDDLFDQLAALDFTEAEVRIILNLKLREREENAQSLKVAVVDCNPETLMHMSAQLRKIEDVELYSYLLSDILAYPYKLSEEMDLVVTTTEHVEELRQCLAAPQKLLRVALRLSPRCVAKLVRLPAGKKVGLLCASEKFASLLLGACRQYSDDDVQPSVRLFDRELDTKQYLSDKDVILVPDDYERFFDAQTNLSLRELDENSRLIRCAYRIDEGSTIHLEEKIARLKEKRAI